MVPRPRPAAAILPTAVIGARPQMPNFDTTEERHLSRRPGA